METQNLYPITLMPSTMEKLRLEHQDRNLRLFLTLALPTCGFLRKSVPSQTLPVVSKMIEQFVKINDDDYNNNNSNNFCCGASVVSKQQHNHDLRRIIYNNYCIKGDVNSQILHFY